MRAEDVRPAPSVLLGRYAVHEQIAAGGMASVYLARLVGPVGFSRTVAIKKLHPQFASDPEFAAMFLDEARLAARVRHPNVIQTLDVVARDGELFHVMEYVHGQTLAQLVRATFRRAERVPPVIAANIMMGALHGLHAAHEATDEKGTLLHIVHRDVSPQNIFVGADGVPRVLDFGVAKAIGRLQSTSEGQLKGKLGYMSPEQVRGKDVGPATDVFAASVVLWEVLAGRRLYVAENQPALFLKVLEGTTPDLAEIAPETPAAIVDIVKQGLARDPRRRFASARQMALALERAVGLVSAAAIGEWVAEIAHDELGIRARMVSLAEITPPPITDGEGEMLPAEALELDADKDPDTLEDESSTDPVKAAKAAADAELEEIIASEASTLDEGLSRSSRTGPSQSESRKSKPHETRTTLRMSAAEHKSAASFIREPSPSGESSSVGVAASLRAQAMPGEARAVGGRWMLRGLAIAIALGAAAAFAVKGVSRPDARGSSTPATTDHPVDEPATDVGALPTAATPAPAPAPASAPPPSESAASSDAPTSESDAPSDAARSATTSALAAAPPNAAPNSGASSAPNGSAAAHVAPRATHAASAKAPPRESLYGMH